MIASIGGTTSARGMEERVGTVCRASSRADWAEATALLHDYLEWIAAIAGIDPRVEQPALVAELGDLPGHYGGQGAALFVARVGDLAVGTAAVRCHDDGGAELKRMYIRPVARGLGMADRLIGEVVGFAGRAGADTIWLESLPAVMASAMAVYRRHAFVEVVGGGRTIGLDGMVTMERAIAGPWPASGGSGFEVGGRR